MKKLNLLFMATLVAFGAMFSSCSKDSTDATVTIKLDNAAVSSGAPITGSITTTNSLKTVTVIAVATSGESTVKTITDFSALPILKSTDGVYTIYISGLASGSYKLTAVDENGVTSTQTFTVGAAVAMTFSKVKSVTLGATNTDTNLSSCVAISGSTFTLANAAAQSASIDFIFQNGLSTTAHPAMTNTTIYSPAGYVADGYSLAFSTKNATVFAEAANEAGVEAAANGATALKFADLTVGDLIAYKTAAGKIGYFKVTLLNGSNPTYGGYESITFDLYVQN